MSNLTFNVKSDIILLKLHIYFKKGEHMAYIGVEKRVQIGNWDMKDLHAHPHYEIYFLYKGSRRFFLSNAFYTLQAPCIVIIPPYTMHKTEGGSFERYNIDVSPEYLNEYQSEELEKRALQCLVPDEKESESFEKIMSAMWETDDRKKTGQYELEALFSYFVYSLCHLSSELADTMAAAGSEIPPVVLDVINYMSENICEQITLDKLSKSFFVSKGTLIYSFKKYTGCTPMEFLLTLRLTRAKEQLANTKKGMERIAADCGFSSANYFSLIFRQKEGIAPTAYRREQNIR